MDVTFDERGLVPVIAQEIDSGEILMLAYANREAVAATLQTNEAHYFSRSRGALWRKGETSGHRQEVIEVRYDCDGDALLYRVRQTGPACHTGARSCFYRTLAGATSVSTGEVLGLLERVVAERLRELPEGSYVTRLHSQGLGRVAQKVIEEAGESAIAALREPHKLVSEAADLLFHLTLLLRESGVTLQEVADELLKRHQQRPAH